MEVPLCVAIPSYRRANVISQCSLPLLCSWGVPMKRVHVFVIEEEKASYQAMIDMNAMFQGVKVIVGPLGLHNMRNYIHQYFEDGVPVLHMDDDIKDVLAMNIDESVGNVKSSARYVLTPLTSALKWVQDAFRTTKESGARLWGIYPVRNGYFMKDLEPITTDLRFCVGAFWGMWNAKALTLALEEKEDFERTLLAYEQDGVVVRFNRVCPITSYYRTTGGMQARTSDRKEESKRSCAYLLERWPQWCKLYTGKKNGVWEVRLKAR